MINSPTVAVIIPTFNRKDKLCRFLDFILLQTYPNLQIIVVDSSSNDGTSDLVRTKFPQVTLVPVGDQEYWTGATNAGVQLALNRQVDFIFTINDDAVIHPNHIIQLVELAEQKQLPILGSQINYLTPTDRVWSLGTYSSWGTDRFLKIAYNDVDISKIPSDILNKDLVSVDALPGNGVLIRSTVFKQIGLYNAKFCPHYHGDSELIMRANKFGFRSWITPSVVLFNDFSNDQKRLPLRTIAGLRYTFFDPRSHLFMLPIFYLIWEYCPRSQQLSTLWNLLHRFREMKRTQRKVV
jgi:GT2 family glycosyltransferase